MCSLNRGVRTECIQLFRPMAMPMCKNMNISNLRDDPSKPDTEDSEPDDQFVLNEGKITVGSSAPTSPELEFEKCSMKIAKLSPSFNSSKANF